MRSAATVAASLLFSFSAAAALAGGPPMLAVEMPAMPFDRQTQDAAIVVRATQCGSPSTAEVTGRAEGVVAGKRQSIPLRLKATSQSGTWAVAKQWPDEGKWVLVFSCESHGKATAVVEPPAKGETGTSAKVLLVHRAVEVREIESKLLS